MNNKFEKFSLPVSIILAGVLIAGGIYLNGKITKENASNTQTSASSEDIAKTIRPVDANDHILGSSSARVIIIEYSDTECPYCKTFHSTMNSIMQEYGTSGTVAWVYRHFPITELHAKSQKEAEATECAASLGGGTKFWEYINKVYETTNSNDSLETTKLTEIAAQIGLSADTFNDCFQSGEFTPKVNADAKNAQELEGSTGPFSPYSIIVDTKNNEYYPVEGAYPYASIKAIIDMILKS